ncbi:MAG: GDP-mannose 4,6-dehydratase, partial [Actinomycetota bacterium]|nr:GDP-mannose 4,6-dehydratase [Actinomycetota bacterium]
VYGPGQRPDMAFSRLVDASLRGLPFSLYGDGEQSRDFTYVDDVVTAIRGAALSPWTGVANIGGGSRTTMNRVIELISGIAKPIEVVRQAVQRGDVRHTAADTTEARNGFGYAPVVSIEEGLARMVDAAAGRVLQKA